MFAEHVARINRLFNKPAADMAGAKTLRNRSARDVYKQSELCSDGWGLTVSFDGFKAVNDLSFYVEPNECRVIIGPAGRGNTVLDDVVDKVTWAVNKARTAERA